MLTSGVLLVAGGWAAAADCSGICSARSWCCGGRCSTVTGLLLVALLEAGAAQPVSLAADTTSSQLLGAACCIFAPRCGCSRGSCSSSCCCWTHASLCSLRCCPAAPTSDGRIAAPLVEASPAAAAASQASAALSRLPAPLFAPTATVLGRFASDAAASRAAAVDATRLLPEFRCVLNRSAAEAAADCWLLLRRRETTAATSASDAAPEVVAEPPAAAPVPGASHDCVLRNRCCTMAADRNTSRVSSGCVSAPAAHSPSPACCCRCC